MFTKLKTVYGGDVSSQAQIIRWYKAFSYGRESIQDELRSERPLTSISDENYEI